MFQHALRLIAFSKLHLVLGVDSLPDYKRPGDTSKSNELQKKLGEGESGWEGGINGDGKAESLEGDCEGNSLKKLKLDEQ